MTSSSLINEFYRTVTSWGLAGSRERAALELLVRIGEASGFYSELSDEVALRGMRVIAIQNTAEAAVALAKFVLLIKGVWWTHAGFYIAKMTTPAATTVLDELVGKAWNQEARYSLERAQTGHGYVLERRSQPIKSIVIDNCNYARSNGFRLIRVSTRLDSERYVRIPFVMGHPPQWVDGWVKLDGSCTLGIDLELEANKGELVFNTVTEARQWSKQQGWTVANEGFLVATRGDTGCT